MFALWSDLDDHDDDDDDDRHTKTTYYCLDCCTRLSPKKRDIICCIALWWSPSCCIALYEWWSRGTGRVMIPLIVSRAVPWFPLTLDPAPAETHHDHCGCGSLSWYYLESSQLAPAVRWVDRVGRSQYPSPISCTGQYSMHDQLLLDRDPHHESPSAGLDGHRSMHRSAQGTYYPIRCNTKEQAWLHYWKHIG